MKNQLVLANINLFAVLKEIEDLNKLDPAVNRICKNSNISIEFAVKNGPRGFLVCSKGECYFKKGPYPKCDIRLSFNSPEHFNKMITGNAAPIPTKGLLKLMSFKDNFLRITNRLAYYLKPTDALLKNPNYLKANTILTAYTAFFALSEVANTDLRGKNISKSLSDGIINIGIIDGPSIHLKIKNGKIDTYKNKHNSPSTELIISDFKTCSDLLNGKTSFYKCISDIKIKIKGDTSYISPLDSLLNLVKEYLK